MIWFALLIFLCLPFVVQVRALILPVVAVVFVLSGAGDWLVAKIDGPDPAVQQVTPPPAPTEWDQIKGSYHGPDHQPPTGNMFKEYAKN